MPRYPHPITVARTRLCVRSDLQFHGQVELPDAPACALLMGALGPRMLRLCGSRTSGTITWMTDPKTLREYVVPTIRAAAAEAGRTGPRVVALVPIYVTDDVERARARAAEALSLYRFLPSYRAMLDKQGLAGGPDAAVIGNESCVREQLGEYRQAEATDVGLGLLATADDRERTRAFVVH